MSASFGYKPESHSKVGLDISSLLASSYIRIVMLAGCNCKARRVVEINETHSIN